ncbi:divalent metal cation transporter [Micromonospora sp. DR5-3]|uniref:NRAMP family divalent metal transporter n=1 Tax=unclassified Micromonospora TaxID=2617518 RepID=UPI0011DC4754|nr:MULTISPECIES: divalent metal cation transporter [unclassified Micromonospora]MCW3817066.1 divalent metal cation transporter [Micromonospora sp. DR5-3]TYC22403.1 divalent metal cation transporter [Micromonospora sp. MP36]
MRKLLAATLGILSAIGGFVDIGDLVAASQAGARFGMAHAWVLLVGVLGICAYAEMAGRIAAVSGRAVFDLVRERLGPRVALLNLVASYLVTVITLAAELGGVALALQLATGLSYLLWVPVAAVAVWLVLWRMRFALMERVFGLAGLALLVFAVALFALPTDWGRLGHGALHISSDGTNWSVYWFVAVALFASTVSPYEVFFFSSGGVEERWSAADLADARSNVLIGFPVGGFLALSLVAVAAVAYHPSGTALDTLDQVARPVATALGGAGLAVAVLAFFAVTFGAALETGLSAAYAVAQYFGWQWGQRVSPREAARFHSVLLVSVLLGVLMLMTTINPVQLTEYMLVLSAVVLPLTYLPILVVANDRSYLGDRVNGRWMNLLGAVFLLVIIAASVAAIPLAIITRMGR